MLKNKVISILIAALIMVALLPETPAKAATPFRDIIAEAALLAEADSGIVLFDHKMNTRHPADGLTKIMTLLLAVTACADGEAGEEDLVEMTETAWLNICYPHSCSLKPAVY